MRSLGKKSNCGFGMILNELPRSTYRAPILGLFAVGIALAGPGCERQAPPGAPQEPYFQVVGKLESSRLDEASGLQAGRGAVYFLHNDEGTTVYFTDSHGRDLGASRLEGSKNRDWEDITRIPGKDGPLLVIGDVGDNHAGRKRVRLFFFPEPDPDGPKQLSVSHAVSVRYPDGPRDVEAMAYDAEADRILLLSKRDIPPRLYGIPLDLALYGQEVEAEFLGEVPGFRPPTRNDILKNPFRGRWVSQPTGMDISPDGRLAAVITYRSLYLFGRNDGESWPEAFARAPVEFRGPPGTHDEAVTFSPDGRSVYVTTEGRPAPVYRLELPSDLMPDAVKGPAGQP
jgi:hypothetical protein